MCRLRCLIPSSTLTFGELYTIVKASDNHVMVVNNDGQNRWYYKSRFSEDLPLKITEYMEERI